MRINNFSNTLTNLLNNLFYLYGYNSNRYIMDKNCSEKRKLHEHDLNANKMINNIPCQKSLEKASGTFRLIGDPSRLKILWLLCRCELCVNNIAVAVNMSAPAVSHHLKLLKQSGLIDSKRIGKEIYYRISSIEEAKLLHKSIDDILNIK